jgi:cell wall-associated NlpC family hydrolase
MRFLFLLMIWASFSVWAAPSDDELDRQALEKGLAAHLSDQFTQSRQSMSGKASDLVVKAMGFLGVPYRRGGANENTGFDCSGFVRYLYEQSIGLVLPRRADDQAKATQSIDRNELKPGDLVFFNTMRRTFSHVGIYLGDGQFIHSPHTGSTVRVDDMREAYWNKRFTGARRVERVEAETQR